ncbi:MAG: Holliday junction resolvase RuvX [Deltaproteobacteria bacterium]|nr:Holliday junction resolvase RuvX [Deltaproteobacteria bacterium]MBW1853167.1 Holliday junction resolvase RuvX [Deltaproteobacteria bacterium]MCK5254793.1 Holliday junction resolvase RuvX [Deltaproteobacteria bacterium]
MKILGLDVGSKTIGVAVSDELGIIAQGVTTLKRKGVNHDITQLLKVIEEQRAEKVVVGLPKNMNGSLGQSAKMVLTLLEELEKSVDIPVITWDERLSTVAAERALLEADMSRKKRKKVIDKVAALIILQGYLDNQKRMKDLS